MPRPQTTPGGPARIDWIVPVCLVALLAPAGCDTHATLPGPSPEKAAPAPLPAAAARDAVTDAIERILPSLPAHPVTLALHQELFALRQAVDAGLPAGTMHASRLRSLVERAGDDLGPAFHPDLSAIELILLTANR